MHHDRRASKPVLLLRRKHVEIVLATPARSWIILSKGGTIPSTCPFIQNNKVVVALPICKEISKAVHAR